MKTCQIYFFLHLTSWQDNSYWCDGRKPDFTYTQGSHLFLNRNLCEKNRNQTGNDLSVLIFCFRYFCISNKKVFLRGVSGVPEQCLQKDESSRGPRVDEHGGTVGARDGLSGTLAR